MINWEIATFFDWGRSWSIWDILNGKKLGFIGTRLRTSMDLGANNGAIVGKVLKSSPEIPLGTFESSYPCTGILIEYRFLREVN